MMGQLGWDEVIVYVLSWVIFVAITGTIVLAYKIVMYSVRRALQKRGPAPGFENGIRFITRLVAILAGVGTFVSLSGSLIPVAIPLEVTVVISTAVGTVIALSTTTVVQSFIAGLYIIATRPFKIGDLVRISDVEGIVAEISLNHTKIKRRSGTLHLISNLTILNSRVVTFTEPVPLPASAGPGLARNLKGALARGEVTRYSFTLDMPKENPGRTRRILTETCEAHASRFSSTPRFVTVGFTHKVQVSFIIEAADPETILHEKEQFIQAIYENVFTT